MNWRRLGVLILPVILAACQSSGDKATIAELRHRQIDLREERIEGGLEKAMEGYRSFLAETPESALTPEAIRRLADLKIEKEYGLRGRPDAGGLGGEPPRPPAAASPAAAEDAERREAEADFEERATRSHPVAAAAGEHREADDLERAGAVEAVALYQKLLDQYPAHAHNDQVLYQMSRAYEELGRTEEAMTVMNRLAREYPRSRYLDEVQFRRGEYFFTKRRYLDAEEAYASIVAIGVGSSYFPRALYKLGWNYYKQELYEEALHRFVALLDHQVAVGDDFASPADETERKRLEDTFRVISLGISNLGGSAAAVDYFTRHGARGYEDDIYRNLGEYYFEKRRYADAAAAFTAFASRNPYHRAAPHFQMRVIEIHTAGGFPSLVLAAKKDFATTYGLQAPYWQHFEPDACPEVLGYLKTNLTDLANHHHSLYQNPRQAKEREGNFAEARRWYREFLASFPQEAESPQLNNQLAELLLENRSFDQAAVEFARTAYGYPRHEKSAAAGYAAVYAHRQHLATVEAAGREAIRREVVRSSLAFAESFPEHEKAAVVLGAAADDLYDLGEHETATATALRLIELFPDADQEVRRGAWLVVAHGYYELKRYAEAEGAYLQVLALLPEPDPSRPGLIDNLAAAIYKQGEAAVLLKDDRGAAEHFLRVGRSAPASTLRAAAEYDASAALVRLQDWKAAAAVLVDFRLLFPGHELQPKVTERMAYALREDGQPGAAALEYERIERESKDEEIRREALLTAAELHATAGDERRVLAVYRRYVEYFPRPVELQAETRDKIAGILKGHGEQEGYLAELRAIVALDAAAGRERTPRIRQLAATAALTLAEPAYERFTVVRLVKPFEANLKRKRELMRAATQEFTRLLDYEVGEVTAAATFYLAEIYAHFSKALIESERPEDLTPLELEQYELAIEEQAYPFEEQAITVHEKNLELISSGVYNRWIDRSLQRLVEFFPARYARPEEPTGIIGSLDSFTYEVEGSRPVAPAKPAPPAQPGEPGAAPEDEPRLTALPATGGERYKEARE